MRAAYLAYLTVVGAALGWILHRDPDTYRYIPASIRQYPGAEAVARLMRGARLHDVCARYPVLGGLMAIHHADQRLDTSNWSGEGTFTQLLIDRLRDVAGVALRARRGRAGDAIGGRLQLHQQRALTSRFDDGRAQERIKRFGILPASRTVIGQGDDVCRASRRR